MNSESDLSDNVTFTCQWVSNIICFMFLRGTGTSLHSQLASSYGHPRTQKYSRFGCGCLEFGSKARNLGSACARSMKACETGAKRG